MAGYRHYIRLNEDGLIIKRFSDAFDNPQEGDICVKDDADRHYNDPVMSVRGQYISKWVNGEEVLRTQGELDAEWVARPPSPPTLQERLEAAEQALLALMEVL